MKLNVRLIHIPMHFIFEEYNMIKNDNLIFLDIDMPGNNRD